MDKDPDDEGQLAEERNSVHVRVVDVLLSNAVYLLTIAVVLFFVIDVLAISNGDPITALGLIALSGPGIVLTGILLTFVPAYLPLIIVFMAFHDDIWTSRVPSGMRASVRFTVYLFLAFACFLIAPALGLIVGLLLATVEFLAKIQKARLSRQRASRPPLPPGQVYEDEYDEQLGLNESSSSIELLSAFVVAVLLLGFLGGSVWLPVENLELASNQRMVGYVVTIQDDWATILRDKDRRLTRIRASDLKGRQICTQYPRWQDTTAAPVLHFAGRPNYPKCEKE